MIQLTRLNNHPLVLNSDFIKFVEQAPDTVITLLSGEKIVVRESALDVLQRVVQFRRSVLQGNILCPESAPSFLPAVDGIEARNVASSDRISDRIGDRINKTGSATGSATGSLTVRLAGNKSRGG